MNGKIDNQNLLKIANKENKIDSKIKMPETKIEIELASITKKLLKIERIGVNCNFLQLGGQSFLAFQMMIEIYLKFGIHLQLTSLFQEETIYCLDKKLESSFVVQDKFDLVNVKLQSVEDSDESFFCFHPSGGNVFCYNVLAKLFSDKCTFIGGWSLGGTLELEVAKQFLEKNEKVHPVILIDSPIPYLRKLPSNEYIESWFNKDFGVGLNELDQHQKQKMLNVFKANIIALCKYNPPKTNNPVIIFKATSILMEVLLRHPNACDNYWGWGKLTINIKNVIVISADHYSILDKNNVKFIIENLNKLSVIPRLNSISKLKNERKTYYVE